MAKSEGVEFDIEVANVKSFLGKIVPNEFQLQISADGFHVRKQTVDQSSFTEGHLLKKAFIRYGEIAEDLAVPIVDKEQLLQFVNRFDGKIRLRFVKGELQLISEKRTARIRLGHADIIEETTKPVFEYDGAFKVKSAIFDDAIKNAGLVGKEAFHLKVEGGKFSITVGNKTDEIVENDKVEYKDCHCSFASGFKDVFERLNGEVSIAMNSDSVKKPGMGYPLTVTYADETQKFEYIIAPFNENGVAAKEGDKD